MPANSKTDRIDVSAKPDHLESLSKARPLNALAELIWNAFDADSKEVKISLLENQLGTIEKIIISDDGNGLARTDAKMAFGNLGGSWKKNAHKTSVKKRILHGKEGKGRFKAFALGSTVTWLICYRHEKETYEYTITGNKSNLTQFEIGEELKTTKPSGTIVTITETEDVLGELNHRTNLIEGLTETFALYLRDYPETRIIFQGQEIKLDDVQNEVLEFRLPDFIDERGVASEAILQVIEWKSKRPKKINLCNVAGVTLHTIEPGIRAGVEYNYTAYVRSDLIERLAIENRLVLEEIDPSLRPIIDSTKNKLRTHFREIKAGIALDLVTSWKTEGVYPYTDESTDNIEIARRQVFDICALNVHEYLADFREGDLKTRKFTLRILREALEDSPDALGRILQEVLELPTEKKEELAELLNHTTLTAMIEASKLVADRLAFLAGLEELLFNPKSKKKLEERSQLHKILEDQMWIFGEEFHLSASDESLTTVLKKYLGKLRPNGKIEKVTREDGREGVIDLLLAREVPQNYKARKEFLVIELKRPSQKITLDVKNQIESYALAVRRDERFDIKNTNWTFIAISNEMTEDAQQSVTQSNLPRGFFNVSDNFKVGLMTWGEILLQCKTRLELFKEKLKYNATADEGIAFLNQKYKKYIPDVLIRNSEEQLS